jgi:hypothetical protein
MLFDLAAAEQCQRIVELRLHCLCRHLSNATPPSDQPKSSTSKTQVSDYSSQKSALPCHEREHPTDCCC